MNLLKNLFNKKILTEEESCVSITGIRDYIHNNPSNGLTPVKLAKLLDAAATGDTLAYFELAEEMEEKELQYTTVLSTRKRAVALQETSVEAADDSAIAEQHAEFIREFIKRDTLSTEYFDMLDAVGKGLSLTEIIWDTSEGQWFPDRFEWVDPRWLEFKSDNLRQPLLKTAEGLKPLTPYKYIYTAIKAKSGLDIRGGVARSVAWAYMFKNFSVKDWMSFLELYGQPYRVGKYGSGATPQNKKDLLKAIYSIGSDAAAIIPQEMMIEFIKTEAKSNGDAFQANAEYFDRQISKAVLGQTTTTDAISGGHAVSQEHNEVRLDIAGSDAKQLSAVLNRDLVRPMIDLNFGPQKKYPRLIIGNPEKEDVKLLVDCVAALAPFGLQLSQRQLRSKMGLDAPEDEKDTFGFVSPQFQPIATPALNKLSNPIKQALNKEDGIDILAAEELQEWQPLVSPLQTKIEDLIKRLIIQGADLPALKKELENLKLEPDVLAESLTKATMTVRLQGEQNG